MEIVTTEEELDALPEGTWILIARHGYVTIWRKEEKENGLWWDVRYPYSALDFDWLLCGAKVIFRPDEDGGMFERACRVNVSDATSSTYSSAAQVPLKTQVPVKTAVRSTKASAKLEGRVVESADEFERVLRYVEDHPPRLKW